MTGELATSKWPDGVADFSQSSMSVGGFAMHLLCKHSRLNVIALSRQSRAAADVSKFKTASMRSRSMACDPYILADKMAREILDDPLSKTCALVVLKLDTRGVAAPSRLSWELVLDGVWVPSKLVARGSHA